MTTQPRIRVLLADEQALIRTGMRRVLEDAHDLDVVGEAVDGPDAVALARELQPQVILLDVDLPEVQGTDTLVELLAAAEGVRVIGLCSLLDPVTPQRFLEAGACGFLTKACSMDELITAIRQVGRGGRFVSNEVAAQIALAPSDGASPFQRLSERELQVVRLMAQGRDQKAVSAELGLSPKTVSTYRHRVFEKLGVASDVELTRLATKHQLI